MRRALPLLLLPLVAGCFLSHDLPADDRPPDDPPPDDPPPPPPDDPPPPPGGSERFAFLRADEPGPAGSVAPHEAWTLDAAGGPSRFLFESPERGSGVHDLRARGSLVAGTFSAGSEMYKVLAAPDGRRSVEVAVGGRTVLGPGGARVLHLAADEVTITDHRGEEIRRIDVPGWDGHVSPELRWLLRAHLEDPAAESGRLSVADLETGEVRTLEMPGARLGPTWFDLEERVAYASIAPKPETWTAPRYTVHRIELDAPEPTLEPAFPEAGVVGMAYDRCRDRILAADDFGGIQAYDPETGGSETVAMGGAPPAGPAIPFTPVATLSPDGRFLVWLAAGDGGAAIMVTDLEAGTTTRAETRAPLPTPFECCGDLFVYVHVGNFVDGSLAVGVSPPGPVRLCSCGPTEPYPEPVAYRVTLASGEVTAVPHCGLSVPWLTRDGRMLVCEETEERVRFVLRTPGDGELEPVTEGPYDVAAIPLDRGDEDGCGVRP